MRHRALIRCDRIFAALCADAECGARPSRRAGLLPVRQRPSTARRSALVRAPRAPPTPGHDPSQRQPSCRCYKGGAVQACDTAHAVEQLDWMRAEFFANRPDDRPAARRPSGRVSAASKWADRFRCRCNEAGCALLSGGAGGAARRTRSPRSRSGGRGCGRTRLRHRSRG